MELRAESVEICACRMRGEGTPRISKRGLYRGEVLQRCYQKPLSDHTCRERQVVSNNTVIEQIGVQDTPQMG